MIAESKIPFVWLEWDGYGMPKIPPLPAACRRVLALAPHPDDLETVAVTIRMQPKTRGGKIMRRLLKARELGLPEGDS